MTSGVEASWLRRAGEPLRRAQRFFETLAGRLLALTAAVVLAGEVMIFVPALAGFHETWLRDRINLAQIAALALEGAQDNEIAESLEFELLENAEVLRVAMQRDGERELILADPSADNIGTINTYDYTQASGASRFLWAVQTFFAPDGRVLRVLAKPRFESGDFIEIVLNEAPLKRAMGRFSLRFIFVSMLILVAAGALVYGALTLAFVRPMRHLTQSIERFRDRPEDVSVNFVRSRRADEIGRAERAAGDMAEQIRLSLRQRERLAALGAAVARIGHDLRNMLATAQLVTERLSSSEDPTVRQIAPRLERAIGRAAGLAASTLSYGRSDAAAPVLVPVALGEAVIEAAGDALGGFAEIPCRVEIGDDVQVLADAEHLHRIIVNLIRNAAQAMAGRGRELEGVVVRAAGGRTLTGVEIIDHGPGIPAGVRDRMFEPFVSADRAGGGTGLGLAIARELARAMGGDVTLLRSGSDGTAFQVTLRAAG
ncbi:MAG: HAMP domain-containing sensor histidine kinase [Terricaulis sp.]